MMKAMFNIKNLHKTWEGVLVVCSLMEEGETSSIVKQWNQQKATFVNNITFNNISIYNQNIINKSENWVCKT